MRQLLMFIVTMLAMLFGAGTQATASVPAVSDVEFVHVYTYDGSPRSVSSSGDTTERGPPIESVWADTAYDAVDHRSHGVSARPDEPTPRVTTTYDDPARLAQDARVAGTTASRPQIQEGGRSSLARGRVAANGGQKWAYRGVGRDHPGYDDALKGRVNPRNPNGTATPEQHNLGNTTDSPYTSWTRDPDIAGRFAGPDGVVLRVPRGEDSPYKFEWSPDVFYEQEILIRGPVCGALIC
jgi:hypothetical protein